MPKYKIIVNFRDNTADELSTKLAYVDACMTDNADFPDAAPLLVVLRNGTTVFNAANARTGNNTKEGTASKKQARAVVEDALGALAAHVQLNGKNDPAILLGSGFDLQKQRAPIGPMGKTKNLRAQNVDGIEGTAKLMVAPVPKADGYEWQHTEAPVTDASVWLSAFSKRPNISIALKTRTEYVFRVAAVGTDPTRTFSDKLTFFVV